MEDVDIVIEARDLAKNYGTRQALEGLTLSVRRGEWVALVGPSGCGKSTFLGVVGGHESPSGGSLVCTGKVRTLFQHDALFPWLTVEENIGLGLRHIAYPSARGRKLDELLALTGLGASRTAYPHELSGGMKQRVQFAWALAADADVLLLDEPFSALDFLNRCILRDELTALLAGRAVTLVLVTHDIPEAALLADRILLLTPGPGRISEEVIMKSPRPRTLGDADVVEATARIMGAMRRACSKPPK